MNQSSKPVNRITDLPTDERPRERLARLGPQALSTPELLGILLRVGVPGESAVQVGQRLLNKYHNNLVDLHLAPFEDLCNQHGIGEAKAAQLKAAIELGSRMALEKARQRPTINSPADAAALVAFDMSALEQEVLSVILLDTRNQVIDIVEVYKGSINSSQVHVGELFKPAIRRNAAALIVVHNHPSGDPTPSPDDIAVTRSIVQAGKLLDVDVLDHMVIGHGRDRWVSMKERGLGFG
jgi:DNA repair protein RadC